MNAWVERPKRKKVFEKNKRKKKSTCTHCPLTRAATLYSSLD
jgi:hypothetical protein